MALAAAAAHEAQAAPVLMISIDGLRPAELTDGPARGLKTPTLRALAAEGAYAQTVKGVLPTLTYPSHTTLLTGVSPARHGIGNNITFDPLDKNQTGWDWYAEDIKTPTLWDAAHGAHLKVANVHWPVSVGETSIDLNLPQLWRTGTPDDRKLNRALATRGLTQKLEKEIGKPYADGIDETVEGDETRALFAETLYRDERPDFMTVYLTGLDHVQHLTGPGSPEAHAALERIDAAVGRLVKTARSIRPDVVVVVVSDHGFAPVSQDVNLYGAFIQAGLIDVDAAAGKVVSWEAEPWLAGGSAAVVLARPDDPKLRARVEALLTKLKDDPRLGLDRWIGPADVARMGGPLEASYFINFKIGYEGGKDPLAPPLSPSTYKGMHGYFPSAPEMRSTFIIAGPGVKAKGSLGDIDMRDIAPTVAKVLKVRLPDADGRSLF